MARIDTLANFLTDVADSIRTKTNKTDSIHPKDFDTEISKITGTAPNLQEKTVSASVYNNVNVVADDAYDGLSKVTITKIKRQDKEITPTTSEQTITADEEYDGLKQVNVKAVDSSIDENIKPENIIEGVEILGVQGNYDTKYNVEVQPIKSGTLSANITSIKNITLKNLDANLTGFFMGLSSLTEIPYFECNSGYMQNFCSGCSSLIEFPSINTSRNSSFYNFFAGCKALKTIRKIDMRNAILLGNFALQSTELENIEGFENLGKAFTKKEANFYGLDLSNSTKLTHDSLMNVINNLYDLNLTYNVASGGTLYTQSLQIGETNIAKLTAEEIAIATSKGFNVS